jgi:hypothetical protein
MSDSKCCPQCGADEEFYSVNAYPMFKPDCNLCGYCEAPLIKRSKTSEGFGILYLCKAGHREVSAADKVSYMTPKTDYDQQAQEFDQLVSKGEILPEKSYLTRVEGNKVEFLRGNIENARNRLTSVKDALQEYGVFWLETNLIRAEVHACSAEEALEMAKNGEHQDCETVYDGEPHPGTHLCMLAEDEGNEEEIYNQLLEARSSA